MTRRAPPTLARRDFLGLAGSCAAHLAWTASGLGAGASALFAHTPPGGVDGRRIQEEPWGRLERLADGVWALISTPLEDRTTLCNGGIVAGRDLVAVIEAFASPAGATWMAERARALTGRWPDVVLVTHYHGDHTAGLAGFRPEAEAGARPELRATAITRDRTDRTAADREVAAGDPLRRALVEAVLLPDEAATELDLGGRTLRLEARAGHTASDVTAHLDDPSIVFCGDLVWNGMFPNYVDARPSALSGAVAALDTGDRATVYVPGHGSLADPDALSRYRALLDHLEGVARDAHERGLSAEDAAVGFAVPGTLGDWYRFSPAYPERAIGAWLEELSG